MIALQLSDDDASKSARRADIINGLYELSAHIRSVLSLDSQIKKIADRMIAANHLILLGRGYQGATCLEGPLFLIQVL